MPGPSVNGCPRRDFVRRQHHQAPPTRVRDRDKAAEGLRSLEPRAERHAPATSEFERPNWSKPLGPGSRPGHGGAHRGGAAARSGSPCSAAHAPSRKRTYESSCPRLRWTAVGLPQVPSCHARGSYCGNLWLAPKESDPQPPRMSDNPRRPARHEGVEER